MVYTLYSGTVSDVYELADRLDIYLEHMGWSRWYTLSSGLDTRDRVYFNNYGTVSGTYNPVYARFNANNSILYNYAYTYYSPAGSPTTGQMGGDQYSSNYGLLQGSCKFWFIGDKDVVWIVANNTVSGTFYSSSIGLIDTYYDKSIDSYPVCVVGQYNTSHDFLSSRAKMYNYVGTPAFYHAENCSNLLKNASKQSRDSSYFGMPIVLVNDTVGQHEIRGELKGIRQVYGSDFTSGDILYINNTSISGTYLVIKHDDSTKTYAYGPYINIGEF